MEWLNMTAKEYRERYGKGKQLHPVGIAPKTANKYNAKKTEIDGMTFDSKKEAKIYQQLQLSAGKGLISDLQRQVKFELIPKQKDERPVYYVADYVFKQDGKTVVADCKSAMTKKLPAYIIKRKLFKVKYPQYEFLEM